MNHTEGICISPLCTAVSYSVTEYWLVFVLDPGRAHGACHAVIASEKLQLQHLEQQRATQHSPCRPT